MKIDFTYSRVNGKKRLWIIILWAFVDGIGAGDLMIVGHSLKKMVRKLKPGKIIPIHTFCPDKIY